MIGRRYEPIEPLSREESLRMLEQGDGPARSRALLALALYDNDWHLVQDLSLALLKDEDPAMQGTAATALGHLARIHRNLDLDRVLPALNRLRQDEKVGGQVEDALSDIDVFIHRHHSMVDADWLYAELRRTLELLSASANEQIAYLETLKGSNDELGLEFDSVAGAAAALPTTTPQAAGAIQAVSDQLTSMSGPAHAGLWEDEGIRSDARWQRVRELAKIALELVAGASDEL